MDKIHEQKVKGLADAHANISANKGPFLCKYCNQVRDSLAPPVVMSHETNAI